MVSACASVITALIKSHPTHRILDEMLRVAADAASSLSRALKTDSVVYGERFVYCCFPCIFTAESFQPKQLSSSPNREMPSHANKCRNGRSQQISQETFI